MSILQRINKLNHIISRLKTASRDIHTTPQRYALNWSRRSKVTVESLKLKDNIPEAFELIYRAPLEKYLKWAKNMSTATAAFVAGLALFKYSNDHYMLPRQREISLNGLVSHEEDIWYFTFGFIALNVILRVFVHKFPLRIYRNANHYIAIFDTQIPFVAGRHVFQRGQVSEISHFFNPWKHITYRMGNRTTILLNDYFRTPSDFHHMF